MSDDLYTFIVTIYTALFIGLAGSYPIEWSIK